jgi:hypothetical protein
MSDMRSDEYFDWVIWRFAYAQCPHWDDIPFPDGKWRRVVFGLYWRYSLAGGE